MEPGLDYHGRERHKSRVSIEYFVANHVHFGWYPEVVLTDAQRDILHKLVNNSSEVVIQAPELVMKWPLISYFLHELVFGVQIRIAVVAEQQWQANRRYQGILYPMEKMGDIFTPDATVRTAHELELLDGNCIKTFTQDSLQGLRAFGPSLVVAESSQILAQVRGLGLKNHRTIVCHPSSSSQQPKP